MTIDEKRGDSIVSTQVLVCRNQTNRKTDTKITLPYRCVSEATQLYAETRDPPSQDPRDHMEQALRYDTSHEKTLRC